MQDGDIINIDVTVYLNVSCDYTYCVLLIPYVFPINLLLQSSRCLIYLSGLSWRHIKNLLLWQCQ